MAERIALRRALGPSPGETHQPDAGLDHVVRHGTQSGGRPLPAQARAKMEERFGHDFAHVRVFSDSRAGESAEALAAKAYTVGSDIVFREGEYSPESTDGEELLAHELTHVVQQGSFSASSGADSLDVSQPGDPAEREAEEVADSVMAGCEPEIGTAEAPAAGIHRWPWDDDGSSGGGGGSTGGVLDSLGSMASGAWDATKGAANTVYQGYEKQTDFKSSLGEMDKGIDWLEKKNAEGAQMGADSLKGIPVLEQLGQASAFMQTQTGNLAGGVMKGVGDLAGGIGNVFFHPIDTLGGMESIAEHDLPMVGSVLKAGHGLYDLAANTNGKGGGQYGNSFGELANHLFNPMQQMEDDQKFNSDLARGIVAPGSKDWNEAGQRIKDNPMDTLGRAATNIAPMVMGLGEASAGEGAAEAGNAVPKPVAPPVDAPPPVDVPPVVDTPPSTPAPSAPVPDVAPGNVAPKPSPPPPGPPGFDPDLGFDPSKPVGPGPNPRVPEGPPGFDPDLGFDPSKPIFPKQAGPVVEPPPASAPSASVPDPATLPGLGPPGPAPKTLPGVGPPGPELPQPISKLDPALTDLPAPASTPAPPSSVDFPDVPSFPSSDVPPPSTLRTPFKPPGVPDPAPFNPDIPVIEPEGPPAPKPAPADAPPAVDPNAAPPAPQSRGHLGVETPRSGQIEAPPGPELDRGDPIPETPPQFKGQPRPFPAPQVPSPLFPDVPDLGSVPDPATIGPERPPNTEIQPSSQAPSPPAQDFPPPSGKPVSPTFDPDLGFDPAGPIGPNPERVPVPSGGFDPDLGFDPAGPIFPKEGGPPPVSEEPMPATQDAPPSSGGSATPTLRGLGGMPAIPRGFDPGGIIQLMLDTPGAGSVVQLMQDLGFPVGRV